MKIHIRGFVVTAGRSIFSTTLLMMVAATHGQHHLSASEQAVAMAARIDELLAATWEADGIRPAEPASDGELIRRLSLDLNGVIPTEGQARQFFAAESATKRQELVDQLLNSPRYPTHMANTFRDIILPDGNNDVPGADTNGFHRWLRRQFVNNLRYDRIVSEFFSSVGNEQDGPAIFYRVLETKPEKLAATTARVFLGLQLECAQCHDHPFDDWSQKDFWGYAAFFAQIQTAENAMQTPFRLQDRDEGEVSIPGTKEVVSPKYPRGDAASASDGGSRRMQLSIWMASRDNPFLPRAAVNRVWALMFGRGLVNPVDDIGPHNPPVHPELMDALTEYFVESNFDLKELFRAIGYSKTYQLSSKLAPVPTDDQAQVANEDDKDERVTRSSTIQLFERMHVKTMSSDQLFDSLAQAFRTSSLVADAQIRRQFVSQMGGVARDRTQFVGGLQQALNMMNGNQMLLATGEQSRLLGALKAPYLDDDDRIVVLFLTTLTRKPSEVEKEIFASHLADLPKLTKAEKLRDAAYGDILWALVNSAEFQLNH